MNIYRILTAHYAPKDSHTSMMGFVLANNDEQVFNWINTDPTIHDKRIFGSEDTDKLNDDNDGYGYEIKDENYNTIQKIMNYKDYLIHVGGLINSEYEEYEDLYYGKTLYGWEIFKENIGNDVSYQFVNTSLEIGLITDIRSF